MERSPAAATPRWTVPARRQVGLLWESGRVWFLFGISVLPVIFLEAGRLHAAAQGRANMVFEAPVLMWMLPILVFVAPMWGMLAWSGEAWEDRQYHWSLPVAQGTHDLWRVVSGAFWLVLAVSLATALSLVFAALSGEASLRSFGLFFWLHLLTIPLSLYLVATVFSVATQQPLRWELILIALVAMTALIGETFHVELIRSAFSAFFDGRYGFIKALHGGVMTKASSIGLHSGGSAPWQTIRLRNAAKPVETLVTMVVWLVPSALAVVLAVRRRP